MRILALVMVVLVQFGQPSMLGAGATEAGSDVPGICDLFPHLPGCPH